MGFKKIGWIGLKLIATFFVVLGVMLIFPLTSVTTATLMTSAIHCSDHEFIMVDGNSGMKEFECKVIENRIIGD